jgi:hypothetical protein
MGTQPAKSCILNPPFQPRAAAFAQRLAHVLIREQTPLLRPQSHRQRDKTIQVGGMSQLFKKASIRQDQLAETFQVLGCNGQSSVLFGQGTLVGSARRVN